MANRTFSNKTTKLTSEGWIQFPDPADPSRVEQVQVKESVQGDPPKEFGGPNCVLRYENGDTFYGLKAYSKAYNQTSGSGYQFIYSEVYWVEFQGNNLVERQAPTDIPNDNKLTFVTLENAPTLNYEVMEDVIYMFSELIGKNVDIAILYPNGLVDMSNSAVAPQHIDLHDKRTNSPVKVIEASYIAAPVSTGTTVIDVGTGVESTPPIISPPDTDPVPPQTQELAPPPQDLAPPPQDLAPPQELAPPPQNVSNPPPVAFNPVVDLTSGPLPISGDFYTSTREKLKQLYDIRDPVFVKLYETVTMQVTVDDAYLKLLSPDDQDRAANYIYDLLMVGGYEKAHNIGLSVGVLLFETNSPHSSTSGSTPNDTSGSQFGFQDTQQPVSQPSTVSVPAVTSQPPDVDPFAPQSLAGTYLRNNHRRRYYNH